MEYLITFVLVALLFVSPFCVYLRMKKGHRVKGALLANVVSFFAFCIIAVSLGMGQTALAADEAAAAAAVSSNGIGLVAAALATGLSCVGAGIAVAASASSALGAISEDPKAFGKALIFVVMAEGIALYGLLISFQILAKV